MHIDLLHPGARTSLNCVALSAKDQSLDLHSSILHDAESAVSRQQQRNIVGDNGEVIFKGKIKVPKHAQLTDSDQLCRTLMLGNIIQAPSIVCRIIAYLQLKTIICQEPMRA